MKTKLNTASVKAKKDKAFVPPAPKRFYRSETNKVIGGVCGGLGEYFNIDPSLIRVAFVILAIAGVGAAVPIYVILWIVLPSEHSVNKPSKEYINENTENIKTTAEEWTKKVKANETNSRLIAGLLLVCLGLAFLFQTFGIFDVFKILDFNLIWPVILIAVGLLILFKQNG